MKETDEIKINDEWRIKTDPLNIILERKYTGKDKEGNPKEHWKIEGFYPNYKYALNAMVNKDIMGINDIKTMVQRLEKIEKDIAKLNI